MRDHLQKMLGVKSYKNLHEKFPPLTEDENEAIEKNARGAIKCTATDFRIDFEQSWKKSHLNADAALVFNIDFIQAVRNGLYSKYEIPSYLLTDKQVDTALEIHMEYCKRQYRFYRDHDEDTQKMLTGAERKQKAVNTRKKTVSNARFYLRMM